MDNQLAFGTKKQIISVLPVWKNELEILFTVGDENFMGLVHDFLLCKRELKRFQDHGMEAHASEYQELVKELEEELIIYLKSWKSKIKINGTH